MAVETPTRSVPVAADWRENDAMRAVRQMAPLLIVVAALLALFAWRAPGFLSASNMIDLAQQISINAIIAFGITLTILIGGIDLSVGAVLALVGTLTAYILTSGEPTEPSAGRLAVALLAALGAALLVGVVNGVCAAKTKMPPFIITLAMMLVARGLAHSIAREPISIPSHETAFLSLGTGQVAGIPVPVLVMLAIFALAALLLHRTRFGQHLYAIGGNREAARFTGIPLPRLEISVYIICALLAGIAGLINTSQLFSAEPASGEGFELDAIAAAVVGGTSFTGGVGTMYGTLLGAIIIGILSKGLNQAGVHFSLQYIIKGAVILAAVYWDARRRR